MRSVFLSALCIGLLAVTVNAQTPRVFHTGTLVLDNGSASTDTVKFTGGANSMVDLSGLFTNNANLTLNTNLDMNNKNLLNGGSGAFTSVIVSGNINTTAGVFQTKGVTRIDSLGNGSFSSLTNAGSFTVPYAVPGFNVPGFLNYNVGPNDYFIESIFTTDIYLPSSLSYPGRVLKIANMNINPLTIHFAPGDHTISTPPLYSFSLTLNSGACVTLISDGGISGWVQTGH